LHRSSLQIEDITELLEVCVRTTYFHVEDRFYQQKSGMATGSSLSPIISNIFMEHLKQLALDSVPHKPAMRLRYVDDTFVMWPHGTEKLQEFLSRNNLRSTIQFTMETETGDVLVYRNGTALMTKVYWQETHTLLIPTILLTLRDEWCIVSSIEQQPSAQKSKSIPKK
jgi:hypothetical protein